MPEQHVSIDGRHMDGVSLHDNPFLLYHGRSHVTGKQLGQYLGIPHGRELGERCSHLIRWGSRTSTPVPRDGVVNSRRSIRENTDKLNSLRALKNAGIPVPEFTTDRDEIADTFGYPALGRNTEHTRGQDINLILQWRDTYLTNNDYYVQYIPTHLEYRMHVVCGEVVKVHEKRLRSDADNHPYIRNAETGWVFLNPRDDPPSDQLAIDAVGCLGLDFGAVDVVMGEDGEPYVLEVNTAPSLDAANIERYGDALAAHIGLEEVAGLDAVDFPDDEEEEEEADESDVRNPTYGESPAESVSEEHDQLRAILSESRLFGSE